MKIVLLPALISNYKTKIKLKNKVKAAKVVIVVKLVKVIKKVKVQINQEVTMKMFNMCSLFQKANNGNFKNLKLNKIRRFIFNLIKKIYMNL